MYPHTQLAFFARGCEEGGAHQCTDNRLVLVRWVYRVPHPTQHRPAKAGIPRHLSIHMHVACRLTPLCPGVQGNVGVRVFVHQNTQQMVLTFPGRALHILNYEKHVYDRYHTQWYTRHTRRLSSHTDRSLVSGTSADGAECPYTRHVSIRERGGGGWGCQ